MTSIRYRAMSRQDSIVSHWYPGVRDFDTGAWVDDARLDDADWATACRVADDLNATLDDGVTYRADHPAIGNAETSTPNVKIMNGLLAAANAKALAEGTTLDSVITHALWQFMTEGPRYRIPMRNILREETAPYSHIRVRTVYQDGRFSGHVLYIMGGDPKGRTYRTDRGLLAAIDRNADIDLPPRPRQAIEVGTRNESWNIADVHARLASRVRAGEVPWGYTPGKGTKSAKDEMWTSPTV